MARLLELCVTYDPVIDTMWVDFRRGEQTARTRALDLSRIVDLNAAGQPIVIELVGVSRSVNFAGLPEEEAVRRAVREARLPA